MEGDCWFSRNVEKQEKIEDFADVTHIVDAYKWLGLELGEGKVLEIGSGTGLKLFKLFSSLGIYGIGIEPSVQAVKYSNEQLGEVTKNKLRFLVGTSDSLPFDSGTFDLVYLSFCMYLVDRSLVEVSMEEASRVLRPGGMLAICDFDVESPINNPYIHKEGVVSHKENYLKYLDGKFTLMSKIPMKENGTIGFEIDVQKRISLWTLQKIHREE